MNRFNAYFVNHFSNCTTLVEGYDPHRDRKVLIKIIPGDFSIVGVTDGVDAWVAPLSVAPSELFDLVRKAMEEYLKTSKVPAASSLSRRRPLTLPPPETPTPTLRRRLVTHS